MDLSFWEYDAMLDADVIVIGGGIVGLQTALELRARHPQARIVVLERGLLPEGASTRNAGFACFGSLTEILSDLATLGEAATLSILERRWRGLQGLRRRIGDAAMGYEGLGGFELLLEPQLAALERLDEINRILQPLFGQPVFALDAEGLRTSGFGSQVKALIRNPLEGQLHSGRLMRSLSRLASGSGIEIHTGAQVASLDESGTEVIVQLADARGLRFRAARVAVCTNGVIDDLLPEAGIKPARGQVLVTAPIAGLPWRGAHHLDRGFYYFRNVGERILLGGGRHLDFAAEAGADMRLTDAVQSALDDLLRTVILPGRELSIDHRWAGVMGFSADRQPLVRRVSERIAVGFGCNGMGVALAAEIAAQTAALLA